MIEHWRDWIYPLGFIAPLAFGARMLTQWLTSEWRQKSSVTPLFWKLSLIGNLCLWVHSILQMQGHVALIQACNGIISWRNLNLMSHVEKQKSLRTTYLLLILSLALTAGLLIMQGGTWFRIPQPPWETYAHKQLSVTWHVVGSIGLVLFNSRFWLQWAIAEKFKTSHLGSSFWWTSLIGDTFCLIYFIRIADAVNFIGPLLGLIPYVRNLMLLHKAKRTVEG